ncbi:MAG TPA: NUDIX domain-containing protein [Vicinamibacterales bacterium]|nr:NUDIX domain-containing protein [Vicinamibacterales bacterium]
MTFTHAGGIVVRGDNPARVLLVRAKPAPHDWVLPKGHIDPGETPEQTARREVIEEAGVEGHVERYVDLLEFDSPRGEHVSCAYYLMRFEREVSAHEDRQIRWATFEEALRLIRFDNTRSLIRTALSDRR